MALHRAFRIIAALFILSVYPPLPTRAEPTLMEMLGWRAAVPLIASPAQDDELLYVPREPSEPIFSQAIEEARSLLEPSPQETAPAEAPPLPAEETSSTDVKIY